MAEVNRNVGLLLDKPDFKVVKKQGLKGDIIQKHNHPEANVTFTLVYGKIKVFINDNEEHILSAGDVLSFDGNNYINAELLEESVAIVHLINKK